MHLRPVIWVFIQINMTTLTVHWPAKCHNDVLTPDLCLSLLLEVPVPKANVLLCFFGSFREQSTKWPQSRQLPRYMLHQSPPPIGRFTCVIQKDCAFLRWIPKSTGFDSLEVAQRISGDFTTHHGTFSATPQPEPRSNQRPSW